MGTKMRQYALLFAIVAIVTCFNCPDGTASQLDCRTNNPNNAQACSDGLRCYAETVTAGKCCNASFCTDTLLQSYSTPTSALSKFHIQGDLHGQWVNRKNDTIEFSCPVPISALFSIKYSNNAFAENMIKNLDAVEKYPFNKKGEQWEPLGSVKIDTCRNNDDCKHLTKDGTVGYCYRSRNPSITQEVDTTQFCYKLKELTDSNYHIAPSDVGPKFCSTNSECASLNLQGSTYDAWYCHTGVSYSNRLTRLDGSVCMRTRACADKSFASRPSSGDTCDVNSANSCIGAGPANSVAEDYTPSCISLKVGTQDTELCCQKKLPSCSIGKTQKPRVPCKTISDCNKKAVDPSVFDTYKYWCDPVDEVCCEPDTDDSVLYCPDGATPLRYEKKCKGYVQGNETTGKCDNKHLSDDTTTSGLCKYGHCCPELQVKGDHAILGKYSFATSHPCKDGKVAARFRYAYCDEKKMKVVVIGAVDLEGLPLISKNKTCTVSKDCANSGVCVQEKDGHKHCYDTSWADVIAAALTLYVFYGISFGMAVGIGIGIGIILLSLFCCGCECISKIGADKRKKKEPKEEPVILPLPPMEKEQKTPGSLEKGKSAE